jgi:hypothetical protein
MHLSPFSPSNIYPVGDTREVEPKAFIVKQ